MSVLGVFREEGEQDAAADEEEMHSFPIPTDKSIREEAEKRRKMKMVGKTIRWSDETGTVEEWCTDEDTSEESTSETSDSDGSWNDEEDEEWKEVDDKVKIIKVKFTKVDSEEAVGTSGVESKEAISEQNSDGFLSLPDSEESLPEEPQIESIKSPKDVHRQFIAPCISKPFSILKSTSSWKKSTEDSAEEKSETSVTGAGTSIAPVR